MKRHAVSVLSLIFALIFSIALAPGALAAVPDRPENQYVLDSAGVLSSSTERRIISENQELFEDCGAEIVIVAVDFLGGESIEDYAYRLFNSWGIGSTERNNGLLLVLAIGEENYYAQAGYGIDDYFSETRLDDILTEYLEPDFAKEDYEEGVEKTFDVMLSEMSSYYKDGPGRDDPLPESDYEYSDDNWNDDGYFSGGWNPFRTIKTIAFAIIRVVVVVAIILFIFSFFRGPRGGGPGGGGGGGFWRGMWLGSMMNNRRRTYWGPPPPPPPGHRPGGFGGFGGPRGGFGGGHRGGFSQGGRSHGGGAGRGFGGGGGFHGGGGSHGGGAGRH